MTVSTNHYAAVCACVRDEPEDDLREWLEWHLRIGFEHFYLFDDRSAVPLVEILGDYAPWSTILRDEGLSSRAQHRQMAYYSRCIQEHGTANRWMAFFDVDEMLVLHPPREDIRALLAEYEEHGGLVVNWKVFGTHGHQQRPAGLVIENFRQCRPDGHVKTIAQCRHVASVGHPHFVSYRPGQYAVDPRRRRIDGPFNPDIDYSICQLNHYFTKSRADFEHKIRRGRADTGTHRTLEELEREERSMTEEDHYLAHRAGELRQRLEQRRS